MLQKALDDMRRSVRTAVQAGVIAAAAAFASFIALCFLCAAAFVFILDRYGLLQACFAGAAVFALATAVLATWYLTLQTPPKRPEKAAKSAMQTAIADPMVIAAGLQLVRTIGIRRLLPLIAIGGVALGMFATSSSQRDRSDRES
jgi:hypothetical protein